MAGALGAVLVEAYLAASFFVETMNETSSWYGFGLRLRD
jgi:hypothetical protein